jgi:hypothetical protein
MINSYGIGLVVIPLSSEHPSVDPDILNFVTIDPITLFYSFLNDNIVVYMCTAIIK